MSVTTPNMNLIQPVVATDTGLTWENAQNSNSGTLDLHNHTSGNGVQIPPSGLNINTTLSFNNQIASSLQGVVFTQQTSFSSINSLYVGTDGNLYYVDGLGDPAIKITSGGTVNATSSGITSGTATAAFSSGVLVVNSATNTPANIQAGSLLLGNNVSGSKFLTLSPPAAMATNFTLTLPTSPAVTSFVTLDSSGNIVGSIATAGGLTPTNIAPTAGLVPTGTALDYFGTTAPTGWLLCQGQAVSRTTYVALFGVIGTSCGVGDGSTTFNLPIPTFYRPVDSSGVYDPDVATRPAINGGNSGAAVGSFQGTQNLSHNHGITTVIGGGGTPGYAITGGTAGGGSTASAGGNQSNPSNQACNKIIKT